jgi:diacylglycerol kinase family enzyme
MQRRISRRLAARLALLAVAGVALSVLALVVRHTLAIFGALVLLALAAAAVWVAATKRGVVRWLAAAAAALLVISGAVALVAAGAVGELATLALSAALFGFALRRAFDDGPARRTVRVSRRSKILLINPRSGDGRAARADLSREAVRRGVDPIMLEPGADLLALAREAARRADVIGMAGGDGSQALVAGVASEQGIGFVCVPAGTRNHFALDLGIDRDDVVGALDAFDSPFEWVVDLGQVNGRTFVNNVSFGVYAEIVQEPGYREAKLGTAAERLPDLLDAEAAPLGVGFLGPDGKRLETVQMLLVSNNPYVLDRFAGFGERPRLDTGCLGIVAVEISGATDAAEFVSLRALRQLSRFHGWNAWSAPSLLVDAGRLVAAAIDGEAVALEPPIELVAMPGALRVLLAPDADRRRRTRERALGGAGRGFDDLVRVATGQTSHALDASSPSGDEAPRRR